jgi:hypothetical protein
MAGRVMKLKANPETLIWSATSGPAQVDVYRIRGGKFEVDVANDKGSRTYAVVSREQALAVARHKLKQFAVNPGFLSNIFGTQEYVYPMRGRSKQRTAPPGKETRYLGALIRRTDEGDYVTSVDWDSRFDTLSAAKSHVKWWMNRNRNPRSKQYSGLRTLVKSRMFQKADAGQRAALLTFLGNGSGRRKA